MQRWIAAGIVAMMLFLGGSYFAYRAYQQNRPHPVWVPLQINPALPLKERDEVIKQLFTKLSEKELLMKVSKDLNLKDKWKLASDREGADEIGRRLFVRAGEADTPMGKVPAIHIGVNGKVKEQVVSGEIAMRLMDDVWKIVGFKPKKGGL